MNNSQPQFLGIDVGATKIEICTFDQNYQILQSKKIPTTTLVPGNMGFVERLRDLIGENLNPSIIKLGVGFNCIAKDGMIVYSSLLGGEVHYSLVHEFSREFKIPVTLENDVNAMAIAENKMGKGRGVKDFVLISIGTGIRIVFVHNGELMSGFTNNAGEISDKRMLIPELAYKEFLIDDFLSGRGIANIYWELSRKKKTAQEVFSTLAEDLFARQAIDIFIGHFARFLGEVSFFYNPEIIILNGSLKKSAHLFLPQVVVLYHQNTLPMFHARDVVSSDLDYAVCLGAIMT